MVKNTMRRRRKAAVVDDRTQPGIRRTMPGVAGGRTRVEQDPCLRSDAGAAARNSAANGAVSRRLMGDRRRGMYTVLRARLGVVGPAFLVSTPADRRHARAEDDEQRSADGG